MSTSVFRCEVCGKVFRCGCKPKFLMYENKKCSVNICNKCSPFPACITTKITEKEYVLIRMLGD